MLSVLALSLNVHSQWSTDPATPMTICDATGDQGVPEVVEDGSGGWFVFWADPRVSNTQKEIYGQHLAADGTALWEPNGRQVLSFPWTSLNEVAAVHIGGGHVMLAVLSKVNSAGGADTVRAVLIDDEAVQLWNGPSLLSVFGSGIFGNCFGFANPSGIRSGDGAYFCYDGDSQGSNGYYVMQRVRADGSVDFTVPGKSVPYGAGYGPYQIMPDGIGGMVVGWRCSNGGGTCHRASRVDTLGNPVWPANLEVSAGGAGLSYAFSMAADGEGGFISVWEEASDLGMARFDTSGTMLWTPTPAYACTESHSQNTPAPVFSAGGLFVAWSDNRPPANNADLYLQRIDPADGTQLWDPDGHLVMHQNSYIPSASIVAGDSGCVIVMMNFTGGEKYSAMRIRPDGTAAWPAPISFSTAVQPFYDDRVQLPDGEGGAVAFWRSQAGDIYGARIYWNGLYYDNVGIDEQPSAGLTVRPNPAHEIIAVQASDGSAILHLRVLDVNGRVIRNTATNGAASLTIPVADLDRGCYILSFRTASGESHQRIVLD